MPSTEAFERADKAVKLIIFATDVDTEALQVGRAGLYPAQIAEHLSPERLRRFFANEGDGYRVVKSLRDLVVLTPQNLIADPPFSRLDLISCRNLLIYLESGLQDKVLRLFHFAIKPDGFLVLGSSETLGTQQRRFRTLSKKWRIFLIAMTRRELRTKTRAALHQAIGESQQVILHGAKVRRGDSTLAVAVTATPLRRPPLVAGLVLVSFHHDLEETREPTGSDLSDLGPGTESTIVHQLESPRCFSTVPCISSVSPPPRRG